MNGDAAAGRGLGFPDGGLLCDFDGTGPITPIQFAQLPIGLRLTINDFLFA